MAVAELTPADAARELLRRGRAYASLVDYAQAITIPGAPVSDDPDEWLFKPIETVVAKHHVVTMEAIERCIRADYGRLMIFEPPGSAKSTYASVVATTWAMGLFPGLRVLMTSYAATPIIRHSKRARQIAASPEYKNIWPVPTTLVAGSTAADEWELTNGSGMFAAGLLGGITSSRCDLGIIDDPVAGREEAESDTVRKKTRLAYDDDFLTRLKPKASIILIMTRWAQEDLAGSILPETYKGESGPILCRDGQIWEVLSIPAQCDAQNDPLGRAIGEFMWPEWFSARHWQIFKTNARTWASLFQQQPTPADGIYFLRDDFKRHDPGDEPENLAYYLATDFATKDEDGDWTAHTVCGIDSNGKLWIVAKWREQVNTEKGITAAIKLIRKWKPALWFGEKGPIESAIGPQIRRAMRKAVGGWAARYLLPNVANKVQRAQGIMAEVSAGNVSVMTGEEGDQLIEECIAFPAGRTDDAVDSLGFFGRALDVIRDGKPIQTEGRKPIIPFTRAHIEGMDKQDADDDYERSKYYT